YFINRGGGQADLFEQGRQRIAFCDDDFAVLRILGDICCRGRCWFSCLLGVFWAAFYLGER
ncbi:hypothetical protein P279_30500, partial [Rhodobacteraceae bacterium PD-2]